MPHMVKKRAQVTIRILPEQHQVLEALAQLRHCSINAIVACFVDDGLTRSQIAYRENTGKPDRLPELPQGMPSLRETWEKESFTTEMGDLLNRYF